MLTASPALAADGFYTADQASQGQSAFNANCSACHGAQLQGGVGPSLKGTDFLGTWGTADGLYKYFSVAMPPTAPGQLGSTVYTQILAYILSANGIPPGTTALAETEQARAAINLVAAAATAPAAPAAAAAAPGSNTLTAAGPMPQAFTYGASLPTVQADGTVAEVASPAPSFTSDAKMPQAFTWGKQLPTAAPAK